jgi:hypothetical protein
MEDLEQEVAAVVPGDAPSESRVGFGLWAALVCRAQISVSSTASSSKGSQKWTRPCDFSAESAKGIRTEHMEMVENNWVIVAMSLITMN